jgi:hypothetical protein
MQNKFGARKRRAARSEQGQALVLGLLLAALGALALVRFFDLGQAVAGKSRLVHTADTAAYSGALTQARALNMLALLNRTQVAHQIAMAHLVTLGSWAMLGGTQAVQAASSNPPVYLIGMLFGLQHGQAYAASLPAVGLDALAREGTGQLAQAFAAHEAMVHGTLAAVQEDIVSGLPSARRAAVEHIVSLQYGDDRTRVEIYDDAWPAFLRKLQAARLLPAVADVAQRYAFLAPRDHTERNPWLVQVRCPWLRHELRRRGQTVLNEAGVWESMDTQSYHALRSNRWIGCYYREYEMGWGWIPAQKGSQSSVPYSEQPPDDFSMQDFWRWVTANTSWNLFGGGDNPMANSRAYARRARWPSLGLPSMWDVAATAEETGFSLRLQRPGDDGRLYTALSAAQAYFRRPRPRFDGRAESANTFRPYWLARLTGAPWQTGSRAQP